MSYTVAQLLLREHEAHEGASLPDRVGGRILKLPTLAWLRTLYDQELRWRTVSITAMAYSENLTEATSEITDYIHGAVGRIKAAEAWAGVIDEMFRRVRFWVLVGLGPLVVLLVPLWYLSGVSTSDLVAAIALVLAAWTAAALISVPLLAVPWVGWALGAATLFAIGAATTGSANVSLGAWWLIPALISVVVGSVGMVLRIGEDPAWRGDTRLLLAVAASVAAPLLVVHAWFQPHHAVWALLGAAGLSIAAYVLFSWILIMYCIELYRTRRRPRAAVVLGLVAVGGAVVVLGVLLRHPGWASVGVRSGLWATLTLLTLVVALLLLSSALTIGLWRWKSGHNPADDVVDTLLAAALTLEFGPEWDPTAIQPLAIKEEKDPGELLREAAERFTSHGWRSPDIQRLVVSQLNFAALLLERDLPQRLRTGNYATDQYLGEQGRRMAAAVQGWARTLLLCGLDGLHRCREDVRRNLLSAAAGEWGAFARADPTAMAPQVSLPRRLLLGPGVLLSAVLPGAIVGGLYLIDVKTSVVVPPALLGSAATFSVVWFLAQVLGRLDPHGGGTAEIASKMLSGADTGGRLAGVRTAVGNIRPQPGSDNQG